MAERINFEEDIRSNKLKSVFLIIVIFVFFVFVGWLIALAVDPSYFFVVTIFATIFSLIYVLAGYYYSDKIALASVNAKPANRTEHKKFVDAAENMALASGLPVPKLFVMNSS